MRTRPRDRDEHPEAPRVERPALVALARELLDRCLGQDRDRVAVPLSRQALGPDELQRPTGVRVGEGSVWVSNTDAGTVSRIDLQTNEVAQTIEVGNELSSSGYVTDEPSVSTRWMASPPESPTHIEP